TTLQQGGSYPITVVNGGTVYSSNQVYAWVDWDQNGVFDVPSEQYPLTQSGGVFTGTITVPTTAPLGSTGMRLRMSWNTPPLPCGTQGYGDIEDYTINVVQPMGCEYDLVLELQTDRWGNETSWAISQEGTGTTACSGSSFPSNAIITATCC